VFGESAGFSLDFGIHRDEDSLAFAAETFANSSPPPRRSVRQGVREPPCRPGTTLLPLQKEIDTMFGGSETTRVTSSAPEDQVYAKIEEGLRDLGSVKVSKAGTITIDPSPSLSSFHTATVASGQVTKEGNDYVVSIKYDCSPTPVNWIISVVLFCLTGIGVLFFLISIVQKGTVSSAVQNAFNQLKSKVK
jgi:hypothetical protein